MNLFLFYYDNIFVSNFEGKYIQKLLIISIKVKKIILFLFFQILLVHLLSFKINEQFMAPSTKKTLGAIMILSNLFI